MQTETELVYRNVSVISSLMPNDKLNTEYDVFSVYTPTTFRAIMRTLWRENREANITKIQATIRQAQTFIQTNMNDEDTAFQSLHNRLAAFTQLQQCSRMLTALKESVAGLQNMLQTYRDDPSICAKITMLCNEIEDFVTASMSLMNRSHTRKLLE